MEWLSLLGVPPSIAAVYFYMKISSMEKDFDEYKIAQNKRCEQHKEDSKEILREIKDELKNIYGLIKDLSDKLYELNAKGL